MAIVDVELEKPYYSESGLDDARTEWVKIFRPNCGGPAVLQEADKEYVSDFGNNNVLTHYLVFASDMDGTPLAWAKIEPEFQFGGVLKASLHCEDVSSKGVLIGFPTTDVSFLRAECEKSRDAWCRQIRHMTGFDMEIEARGIRSFISTVKSQLRDGWSVPSKSDRIIDALLGLRGVDSNAYKARKKVMFPESVTSPKQP